MPQDRPETSMNPFPPSGERSDELVRQLTGFVKQARMEVQIYRKLLDEICQDRADECGEADITD